MLINQLSSLRKLLDNWEDLDQFFYLKRFLVETRQPTEDEVNLFRKKITSNWISWVFKLSERIQMLIEFLLLLWRCLITAKGKAIIFNHSRRVRKTSNGSRPLYLSPLLGLSQEVVFEDAEVTFKYQNSIRQFNSRSVIRFSQLISALFIRLYGRRSIADRDIATFIVGRSCWRLIFRFLRPSCIRLIVWYGKEAVVAAAKSLNIEVVDIQHGILYKSHPFYDVRQTNQSAGYGYLLPDQCYVYGEYWRSLLIESGWHPERVKVVGYYLDTLPTKPSFSKRPYILYTSQPQRSEVIINHIQSIRSELKRRGMIAVIARHPAEPRYLYEGIVDDVVQSNEESDSYDLLRYCEVHLSVSSTLLWEAVVFGKSSYVLDYGREPKDMLVDFLNYGFGRCIKEGEFPVPFPLPEYESIDYFFSTKVNSKLIIGR